MNQAIRSRARPEPGVFAASPWFDAPFSAHVLAQLLSLKWVRLLKVAKKPALKNKRSTKAEHALRIATVYGLLCDGKSRANILTIADEMWGVCNSSADDYIALARKQLNEDCRMSREAFMAEALAGYRSLREQAERRGQLMCAKQCIDAMVDLTSIKK